MITIEHKQIVSLVVNRPDTNNFTEGINMKKFILSIALVLMMSTSALAAELIMFSMSSCGYCQSFLKEVAPTYAQSKFARLLPLRIISMDMPAAPKWFAKAYDERKIDGIAGTPTFVVWDGEEKARLIGYNGYERFYEDMTNFMESNKEALERTVGKNKIPYESETEMDYIEAQKLRGEQTRDEGSHSKSVPEQQHPTVPFMAPNFGAKPKQDTNPHTKQSGKDENGVFFSDDIMDHQYKTPEEAIRAAINKFGCEGIHSHQIKGKTIWMPCRME